MIQINQTYTYNFKFSQEDVNLFAEVTGDKNLVHLNSDFASKTVFKRPIIHGMLGASVFSKVFGVMFPGEGTIYLKQSLNFLRPLYVDVDYEAVFTVTEVISKKNTAIIETIVKNKLTGKLCLNGEASIMNEDKIK